MGFCLCTYSLKGVSSYQLLYSIYVYPPSILNVKIKLLLIISMVPQNLQSPNAIPPRTSSTGLSSSFLNSPPKPEPSKPVLSPVPEGSWLGKSQARSSHHPSSSYSSTSSAAAFGFPSSGPLNHRNSTLPNGDSSNHAHYSHSYHKIGPVNLPSLEPPAWSSSKEKIVLGPFEYMYDHPGKDIRRSLITAFNAFLSVPPQSLHIITNVVGMLHTASLLVDDVEDSSLLRRGVPVAHSIFGTAQTINSANYTYFLALQELLKLDEKGNVNVRVECVRIYTEELCNLHRGQGMDLYWRDTLTCPSESDYLEMVSHKTGGLFRLAIKLMIACSPLSSPSPSPSHPSTTTAASQNDSLAQLVPLVDTIGLLFQIRDDYLNLCSPAYSHNKGLCEDLTEGKFSFPVIHAITSQADNLQLINILKMKTRDDEVKRYAVGFMEERGSFEYCRRWIGELRARAEGLIEGLEKGVESKWGGGRGADGGVGGEKRGDGVRSIVEGMSV